MLVQYRFARNQAPMPLVGKTQVGEGRDALLDRRLSRLSPADKFTLAGASTVAVHSGAYRNAISQGLQP
jgi:hypothetical protein